jgi:FtsH-binding integral membrane protein
LVGLVIPIIGISVALGSDSPVVSFIGYNMVVVPFGVILGPFVNQYQPDIVMHAAGMTCAIALMMGAAGVLLPDIFKHLGGALFIALLGLLIVRIVQLFIPALDLTWIDYLAAGIFSLYVGYDMHRATVVPKTVDNAIDIALALYLDIINLFITILKIMGKKK